MLSRLNQIHLHPNWGWLVGRDEQAELHQHYAIQLSFSLGSSFKVITETATYHVENGVHIPSNLPHRIESEIPILVVLLNPFSSFGHYWHSKNHQEPEVIAEMWAMFMRYNDNLILDGVPGDEIIESIESTIQKYVCQPSHFYHHTDEQMAIALEYIEGQYPELISLNEVAQVSALSEEKFLSAFENSTGLNFNRAQKWRQVQRALPLLHSLEMDEIAAVCGFHSEEELAQTFLQNFGFNHKELLKRSNIVSK